MEFAEALDHIRRGARVTRRAWVTREGFPFLFLVPGSTFEVAADRPMGQAAPEMVGKTVNYNPHIDVCYPDRTIGPWYPHQDAILADDWITVD